MSKIDMGAIVASAMAVLATVAGYARHGFGIVWTKIWASVKATVSSPAVWLAVGITFVGGFWIGHIQGAFGKRALRTEIVALTSGIERAQDAAKLSQRKLNEQVGEAKQCKANAEALEAELSRLKTGRSASVAAVSRRPAPKAPQSKPAASAAAKPSWVPWN